MGQKILIVEDDPTIEEILKEHLNQWGFICQGITDFQNVDTEFQEFQADLILLDISLPFYNGYYWCQLIRETSQVPIIFLSSASANVNMVMAMNMGADDFIAKPFDLSVLVAKIQALIRRSYQFVGRTNISYGPYQLNSEENRLSLDQSQIELTPNESKILQLLFQQVGKIVSREVIMEKLWQSEHFIDSNTLAVNMTRLRKKLAQLDLDSHLQTVRNKGYLLEVYDE